MPTYVAFLRAINVGGHVVKMDRLRRLFEEAGCTDVETVIASGNAVFRSTSRSEKALASRLAAHLEGSLGYAVATFLRTPGELAAVARRKAFDEPGPHNLYIGFLSGKPAAAAVRALEGAATAVDGFRVVGREIYWLCRTGFSRSLFSGARLEKLLGMPTTLRNVTTVRRIADRYPG
jgi:uncharacterized protein (DUF1697 family)